MRPLNGRYRQGIVDAREDHEAVKSVRFGDSCAEGAASSGQGPGGSVVP